MSRVRSVLLVAIVTILTGSGVTRAQPLQDPGALAQPPMSPFISIEPNALENTSPAVAHGGRQYLVVWEEHVHGGEVAIYGRFVGSGGEPLGSSFPIRHDTNQQFYRPDVAYSPRHDTFLVVFYWQYSADDYDIWAMPVSGDGVVGTRIIVDGDLGDRDWYPSVAYNSQADEFLVVYEKYISSTRRDIEAQRVRAADGTLASWRNIAGAADDLRRLPDVAYNAARNEYLIAYTLHPSPTGGGDIVARISDATMATLGSELQITPIHSSPAQDGVAVDAGPDEYFLAWREDYGGGVYRVWGRRVTGAGSLQPFINMNVSSTNNRLEPAVGFGDGGHYLIPMRYVSGGTSAWDIHGHLVGASQNVLEEPEFQIDTTSGNQRSPAVSCAPSGPCLVVYEDNWPGAAGDDYNVMGRLVGTYRIFAPVVLRDA